MTVTHFLNKGKWDDSKLENILKASAVQMIYGEALRSGKPVFCIVDDAISSKTKPSLRALHPIEDAYFHQSHLKRKQDYGHQAVAVMLSCNGIVLNYAIVMYDKTKYPKDVFHEPNALRAFISTDVSLSTREILERWGCFFARERISWRLTSTSSALPEGFAGIGC